MKWEGSSEADCNGTLIQFLHSSTRGRCFPASCGYGHYGEFMDWGFIPEKNTEINKFKLLTREEIVTEGSCGTWGTKAFMKSLQHYTMQCHLIVLWCSILCESLNTLNRCRGFHWPTGLRHRRWCYRNRTLGFSDGTDVHLNVSNFAVVWSGRVHMPWCLWGKKYILGL